MVSWSCHCLNVRLVPQSHPPKDRPPVQVDAKFAWVFVGDKGINVVHTQLTLRTRQYMPANGASGATRQTLLTCLICRIPVYRISSPAESAEDMMDGPVLDANVDLKDPPCSPDGWVEVSTSDCLDDDVAQEVARSSRWSSHFGLALPDSVESMITSSAPSMLPPVFPQLPESSPIFLPYPYTPADPVFIHLSAWAQNVSDNARNRAQAELNEFAQRKFDEFTELDRDLRREVDLIWANWRTAWQSQTANKITRTDRASSSSALHRPPPEPAVSIKDFNSIPSPPPVRSPSSSRATSRVVSSSSLLSNLRGQTSPTSEQRPHSYTRDTPSASNAHSSSDPSSGPRGIGIRPRQSKSPRSSSRLLPQDTADESRAVAASFQIMMSDTMEGSRAAHLARVGLPATYTGEEETDLREDTSLSVEHEHEESVFHPPQSQPPLSSLSNASKSSKAEKKKVQFEAHGRDPKLPPQQRDQYIGEVSLFQLDLETAQIELSKTESERRQMLADAEDLDDAETYARRRGRRPPTESEPSSRSGFNGSLPMDEDLQKLVSLTSPTQRSNGRKDWKQSARNRLRAEAQARSMESLSEQDDDGSSNDEVMVLPRISRWKHKPADLAHSLPVSIGMAMPRNKDSLLAGFALEPKTSLVDRKGILVLPLPRTNSGLGDGAATKGSTIPATTTRATAAPTTTTVTIGPGRPPSKSISSVARERTYAVRDLQRSKDPGESLTVPDEDEDEDEDRSQGHDLDHIPERGRRNAYRILQRQSDVPDETMWRSLAG